MKAEDIDALAKQWIAENPDESQKAVTPASRKKAIKFVKANLKINKKALVKSFDSTYADSVVLGRAIAQSNLDPSFVVDWSKWKPGNRSASALLDAKGALKQILKERDITISGVWRTKVDRVGSILAEGLDKGWSYDKMAREINLEIKSPRHALAIAKTEGARAQVIASRQSYQDAGVTKFEWVTADPCELCSDCEEEARGGVPFGYEFTLGDGITEPPAHPECRCDILPVIESAFEPDIQED